MAGPTFSPDGHWMWDGSNWIPAPPTSPPPQQATIHDSVLGGDVNIPQNATPQSMSMQDSVVGGDVNITQNIGIDGNEVMNRMIQELEKIDTKQSGFHVPPGGFSTSVIIAGIGEIRANIGVLNQLSTDHLVELCTTLEAIGHYDVMLTAANIIRERARGDGNREYEAKAHIFIAIGSGLVNINQRIIHAQEAINIARENGDIVNEAEATYHLADALEEGNKSADFLVNRIDQMLGNVVNLDPSSRAYFLAAKSKAVEYNNPIHAEQLALEAYHISKSCEDLKLQCTLAIGVVYADVHTVEKSEIIELHRQCSVNNFTLFTYLLEFGMQLSGEDIDNAQRIAKLSNLADEMERVHILGASTFCGLVGAVNTADYISVDDLETTNAKLADVLGKTTHVSAIQECLENGYMGLINELLRLYTMARMLPGYTNHAIRSAFNAPREVMNEGTQFFIQLFTAVDKLSPMSEIQNLCRELPSDSTELAETKSQFRQWLMVAVQFETISGFDQYVHVPDTIANTPASDSPNLSSMLMELTMEVKNENWYSVISQSDTYLTYRENLIQQGDRDMVGHAMMWKGLAYFKLGRYHDAIPVLDEGILIAKQEGDDVESYEKLRQLCADSVKPIQNLTTNDYSKHGICAHCRKRPKTTGVTAYTVRGYLIFYQHGQSWAIGCPTCMRIHLLKETLWNALFGWWGIQAFIFNAVSIPINLISIIFVKDNSKKLAEITQEIHNNS